MEIIKVSVERINPAPYNPCVDLQPGEEYEILKRSMQEFGYEIILYRMSRQGILW